jgi:Skp family chaperone for outer membrane proteins
LKTSGISIKTALLLQVPIALAGLFAIWMLLPFHTNAPKIGYVDTTRMLGAFKEAQRNRAQIDSLNKDWQAKAQVLKDTMDIHMAAMGKTYNTASAQSQLDMRKDLERRNQEMAQFVKASQTKVLEKEKALLEPSLKKVNVLLQDLATQEGYDLIFGSTNTGNILAGGRRLDLTDRVIDMLNKKHP